MDGSPSSVVTLGYGNGTFAPEIGLVVTLGYGIGTDVSALYGWLEYTAEGRLDYDAKGQSQYAVLGRTHYTQSSED